ncbi:MAG: MFS transporter [Thermodesulfobacteriota bacterium]
MSGEVNRKTVMFVAAVGSFLTPFMGSSVNIALPEIQRAFGLDAVLLSWVQTSFLLSAAVFMVPVGRLADIHGRKKAYLWGMALFTFCALVSGLAPNPAMLLTARVIQGLGAAMIFVAGMAIVTSVFPPGERGRAIGLNVAAVYVGLSLGPVLGGLLTQAWGWRWVFFGSVPLGLLTVILIRQRIRAEWAEAAGERFDLFGSVLYGSAIALFMFGLTRLPAPTSFPLLGLGLAGLAWFTAWELKVKSPVFEVSLFRRNRVFAFSSLAALIHYSATYAVVFLLSLYLQYIKGLSPEQAGLILVTQPLVMALFSPLAGRLSDRYEPRLVASTGMALTALGLLFFTTLDGNTGKAFLVGNLALLGFGFAVFSSPNMNAIMSSVAKRFLGIASGTVATMRLLGQMTSMGVATVVFALLIGRVEITPGRYPLFLASVKTAFLVFGLFCATGIMASLVRGRMPGGDDDGADRKTNKTSTY